MENVFYFATVKDFEKWLTLNYDRKNGINVYIYKKGLETEGITYEEAVKTALCYGWIDSVTHSCDEKRFLQYFSPRLKKSNWSLNNKIRMRKLIEEKRMTEYGLKYFDQNWLETLDEEIEAEKQAKKKPVVLPEYFIEILEECNASDLFFKENKSTQRRYIGYVMDAKKEETKLRRCRKVASIIKGESRNNL